MKFLAWIGRAALYLAVTLICVSASLVALGRYGVHYLDKLKPTIEAVISRETGVVAAIGQLSGEWPGMNPRIRVRDTNLTWKGISGHIRQVDVEINLWQTLLSVTPIFNTLDIAGIDVRLDPGQVSTLVKMWQGNGTAGESLDSRIVFPDIDLLTVRDVSVLWPVRGSRYRWHFSDVVVDTRDGLGVVASVTMPQSKQLGTLIIRQAHDSAEPGFTVYADLPEVAGLLPVVSVLSPDTLYALSGSVRLWYQQSMKASPALTAEVNELEVGVAVKHTCLAPVKLAEGRVRAEVKADTMVLATDSLHLAWLDQKVTLPPMSVYWHDQGALRAEVAGIPAGLTRRVLVASGVNGTLSRVLAAYAPDGWLRDLNIRVPDNGHFSVEGRLDDVSVRAVDGAPAARHIEGVFRVEPQGGWVQFNSDRLSLAFPRLYANGWRFRSASGRVQWRTVQSGLRIWGEHIQLRPEMGGQIEGRFQWVEDSLPAYFMVDLDIHDLPVQQVVSYVPDREVNPELMGWLRSALRAGQITSAHYRYDGYLGEGSQPLDRRSLLRAEVAALDLRFSRKWPALQVQTADIALTDGQLMARIPTGSLGPARLDDVVVRLERGDDGVQQVVMTGKGFLDSEAQRWWLNASPLAAGGQISPRLANLRYTPGLNLPFRLEMPLSGETSIQVGVDATLEGGTLAGLPDPVGTLEGLQGVVHYDSATGFRAETLRGTWRGQMLEGRLMSLDWPRSHETRIDIRTRASVRWLETLWPGACCRHLSGETPLEVTFWFGGKDGMRVALKSTLEGLASSWPAPLSKPADRQAPLELDMVQTISGTTWTGSLIHDNRTIFLQAYHDNAGWRIRVDTEKVQEPLSELEPGSLWIRVPVVDGRAWQAVLATLGDEVAPGVIRRYRLNAGTFRYGPLRLADLAATWEPLARGWRLALDARGLRGTLQRDQATPPVIKLEEANLDLILGAQSPDIRETDPRLWPALRLEIGQLLWLGRDLGHWRARLDPVDDGLFVRDIVVDLAGSQTKGSLHWVYTPANGQHSTILTFETQGGDFSALSEALHWQAPLTSKTFRFVSSLVWMGPPDTFDLAQLFGRFDVVMEEGVIRNVSASTNIFRLLGVLNTDTLVRRLKLDFSDLYAKGMTYDTLAAQTRIQAGVLHFVQPLAIKTPGSAYNLKGTVDLTTEALDMTMIVALPVSKNLPLAALLVGAPQVGGALFLLDKLLGDPLSKLTTATFDVRGTLSEPKVTIQQVITPAGGGQDKER